MMSTGKTGKGAYTERENRLASSGNEVLEPADESLTVPSPVLSGRITGKNVEQAKSKKHFSEESRQQIWYGSQVCNGEAEVNGGKERRVNDTMSSQSTNREVHADDENLPQSCVQWGLRQPLWCTTGNDGAARVDLGLQDLVKYYTGAPLQYKPRYNPLTPPASPQKRKWPMTSGEEDTNRGSPREKTMRADSCCRVQMSLLYPDVE